MRKDYKKLIELRKKLATLATTGALTVTAISGCAANTNTEPTTEYTVAPTTIETTVAPTETTIAAPEVNDDVASEEYMAQAKAVAEAIYDSNKEYFDEKQYTAEDLENVYYLINGKYYNSDGNIIMEQAELDRSFDIVRQLIEPQEVIENGQKLSDLQNGTIDTEFYFNEIDEVTFYDYEKAPLSNFLDNSENNSDLKKLAADYSELQVKVIANIKNGVKPEAEENLKEFFSKIRSAQTGDVTDYENINNYLQETTTEDGKAFMVAAIYKATADELNTVTDGVFVEVPTKDGFETVRIGFEGDPENIYSEQALVNGYYLGILNDDENILKAYNLIEEEFQTHLIDIECNREVNIYYNFGFISNTNNMTL